MTKRQYKIVYVQVNAHRGCSGSVKQLSEVNDYSNKSSPNSRNLDSVGPGQNKIKNRMKPVVPNDSTKTKKD